MAFMSELAARRKDYRNNRPLTVVSIGDSITHGCFELFIRADKAWDCIFDEQKVYHAQFKRQMAAIFPSVPITVVNAGISGDNAAGGLARLDRDVISFAPQLVTVCFGLNDVLKGKEGLAEYREALEKIISALKQKNIPAVLITPNMLATEVDPTLVDPGIREIAVKAAAYQNDGTMDLYMETVRFISDHRQVPICDFYHSWKNMEQSGVDITRLLANKINHPARDMHGVLAQMLTAGVLTGKY